METMNKIILTVLLLLSKEPLTAAPTPEQKEALEHIGQTLMSLLLIGVDDPLDPEVKALMNHPHEIELTDNGYVYLMGIDQIRQDPYQAGLDYLNKITMAENVYLTTGVDQFDDMFYDADINYEAAITDPCQQQELNDYPAMWQATEQAEAPSDQAQLILDRYKTFIKYPLYEPHQIRTFLSPLPTYRALTVGQSLYHRELLKLLRQGDLDGFVNALSEDIISNRRKLTQVRSYIDLAIFSHLFEQDIELLSFVLQNKLFKADHQAFHDLLKPLTPEELSIASVLPAEFRLSLSFLRTIEDELMDEMSPWLSAEHPLSHLYIRMIWKPNMTSNSLYQGFIKPIMSVPFTDPVAFADSYRNLKTGFQTDPIRNSYGHFLHSYLFNSIEGHLRNQDNLHSVNMKLQLVRAYVEQGSIAAVLALAEQGHQPHLNHYDQSLPYTEENMICYTGLNDYHQSSRCLTLY
jgi:hypothetical protein